MRKISTSLSIGDRDLPLEGDLDNDFTSAHSLVGELVKVSPVAGGELLEKRGDKAEVASVLLRLGQVVGLAVKIQGKIYRGSLKDFFLDRKVLEDIQPPTPYSKALREGLSHWREQRTYWGERLDGLESLCFELSSSIDGARVNTHPWGWDFEFPENVFGKTTVVDCRAVRSGNFWVLTTSVFPKTSKSTHLAVKVSPNPWERTFTWAIQVAEGMIEQGFPWGKALKNLRVRAKASQKILQPMIDRTLPKVLEAKKGMFGQVEDPGPVWGAFSEVRLKPNFVGLTEPPTDRRPYTVISLAPNACKSREYLEQVVLHECIHVAVASRGGEPHNKEFQALAKKLGLKAEHRD